MKNKVVFFIMKIYKKFLGKKLKHEKKSVENIDLSHDEEIQKQKKEKGKPTKSDLQENLKNEANIAEAENILSKDKKIKSDLLNENNKVVIDNEDIRGGVTDRLNDASGGSEQAFDLEISKIVNDEIGQQIESDGFSKDIEESMPVIRQSIMEDDETNEDDRKIEECRYVVEEVESKCEKATVSQNEEIERLNLSPYTYSRADRERLYEEREDLIIQPVKESCLASLKLIDGDSKYIKLRNKIYQDFPKVTLLCEIEINDEEYELLCDHFRKKYLELRRNDGKSSVDVLFCVALVQIGIRMYDGKFWEHISEVLWRRKKKQIPVNQHEWIGDLFTKTMLSFGKPIYRKKEYVNNVMMHCFVTDSFADKFFEFLYLFYNIDLKRDITTNFDEICDYISDSIKNPFGKRKQLLSKYIFLSVRADRKYCKETIKTILRLIDQAFWNEFYDDFKRTRLIEKFFTWCKGAEFIREIQKSKGGRSRKEKQFRTPYLRCFLEMNRFQLVLPPQLLPSYSENTRVYWKVEGRKSLKLNCEIEEGYVGKRTRESFINITPLEIFDEYTIYFYVNENAVRKYYFSETVALFFDEDGINIKGTTLGKGQYYAYVKPSSFIKAEGILNVRKRAGLNFYELNLDYGNIVSIDDKLQYYIGQLPVEGVADDYLIHSMHIKNEDQDLKVYYKLPAIVVEIEAHQINGTAVVINEHVIKLTDKVLYEIKTEGDYEKKYFYLNLKQMYEIQGGLNKIIIDFPGTSRQLKFEFAFLPEFSYHFEDAPYFYVNRGTLVVNRVIKKDTICFNKKIDAQHYDFQFDKIIDGRLNLKIEIDQKQYEVCFDIPVLQYSWDNIQWNTKKPQDIWHSELPDVLYIKYPAEQIMLTVQPSNLECPRFTFFKNALGIFQCDLVRIMTYLNEEKFVNNIILISDGQERKLLSIVMKSFFRGVTFEIDNEKDCVYSSFDIIGKGCYFIDVFCDNKKVLEKQAVNVGTNILNIMLDSSRYCVKVYENEDALFSFDDDYKFVGEKEISLVNPLHLTESCFSIDLIVYDNYTQHLELPYKYYLFIMEKIEKRQYKAVLTEVFHKTQIHTASKVIVTIPDLNNISEVYIEFIEATYGEQNAFLYDNYKKCIVEEESSRYSKSEAYRRYEHVLYPEEYIWIIHNISWDKVILGAAQKWLEDSHKIKHKNSSIWKDND